MGRRGHPARQGIQRSPKKGEAPSSRPHPAPNREILRVACSGHRTRLCGHDNLVAGVRTSRAPRCTRTATPTPPRTTEVVSHVLRLASGGMVSLATIWRGSLRRGLAMGLPDETCELVDRSRACRESLHLGTVGSPQPHHYPPHKWTCYWTPPSAPPPRSRPIQPHSALINATSGATT